MSATQAASILRPLTAYARVVHAGLTAAGATEARAQRWLVAHSVAVLRIATGAVFLAFGALKLVPGLSPAQDLVTRTTEILTLGIVPAPTALVLVATLECVIGLCLVSGRAGRLAVVLLAVQLVGILSPLVLLHDHLFAGPHGAPTLEGQYVLKDVIIVGAAFVIAAAFGGARLSSHADGGEPPRS
ncbi:MAG TPA: DoxX family protein [Solirubrobacteraceae bacterium]|nr:DoxX family protein [Solirubrobacteraceae bacterium]